MCVCVTLYDLSFMLIPGSAYVDSFQVAVPVEGLTSLAIGPTPKDKDDAYQTELGRLIEFWKRFEAEEEAGSVKKFSICDIETATLEALCSSVENKPSSVNVSHKSSIICFYYIRKE